MLADFDQRDLPNTGFLMRFMLLPLVAFLLLATPVAAAPLQVHLPDASSLTSGALVQRSMELNRGGGSLQLVKWFWQSFADELSACLDKSKDAAIQSAVETAQPLGIRRDILPTLYLRARNAAFAGRTNEQLDEALAKKSTQERQTICDSVSEIIKKSLKNNVYVYAIKELDRNGLTDEQKKAVQAVEIFAGLAALGAMSQGGGGFPSGMAAGVAGNGNCQNACNAEADYEYNRCMANYGCTPGEPRCQQTSETCRNIGFSKYQACMARCQ